MAYWLPRVFSVFAGVSAALGAPDANPNQGVGRAIAVDPALESTEPDGTAGFRLSPKLTRLLLIRMVDDVTGKYELGDEQRRRVHADVVKRWERFLGERRSVVQPLVNEFLEMRMGLEPSPKKRIQAWSKNALPMFREYRDELQRSVAEFQSVLNPAQRKQFDLDVLKLGVGMGIAERKLNQWKQGDIDEEVFWQPTRAERRRRRKEKEQEQAKRRPDESPTEPSTPAPVDQIALEIQSWDRYVEEFIGNYALNEGQSDAARSCLGELKERALAHRSRYRDDIKALESRISAPRTDEKTMEDLKTSLIKLYGPIDDMFAELRRRLDVIPTEEQRAETGARGDATRSPTTRPIDRPSDGGPRPGSSRSNADNPMRVAASARSVIGPSARCRAISC